MSKSSLTISINTEVLELSRKKFPKDLGRITEEAFKRELGVVENVPDEMKQLEQLLEVKQNVQRLATQDGGNLTVRIIASDLKKKNGEPKTFKEKLTFWETIYREAKLRLIRARTEEKVSPATPSKKVKEANIFNEVIQ